MDNSVSEAIRLRALGLSVPKIAAALGVNPRTVNKWFAKNHGPNPRGPEQGETPEFDAVAGAMLAMVQRAISQLETERASASKVASTMPALLKLLKSVPRPPSPVEVEEDASAPALRQKLYAALLRANEEAKAEQEVQPSPFEPLLKRMEDRGLVVPVEEEAEEAAPPVPPAPPSAPTVAPRLRPRGLVGPFGAGGNPRS